MNNIYWDINPILRYQRNFNFISSERKIGKTYTTLWFLLKQAILKNKQFVYLCRTEKERQQGILKSAFSKIISEQYPDTTFKFTNSECYLVRETEANDNETILLGYCLALSMAEEAKRNSYPSVKYMILDEYSLPKYSGSKYVHGWDEPDALLSLYQTIDADRDEVIVFCLSNNYTFYNPYHMHPAFNIPFTAAGKTWVSENVLFQRPQMSEGLKTQKAKTRFHRMIQGTEYGDHASSGIYIDDSPEFIRSKTGNCKYIFTLSHKGVQYGVWSGIQVGLIFIDDVVDKTCPLIYALTFDDHRENTMLTKSNGFAPLQWLSKNYKIGNVRYCSQQIKAKAEEAIRLIL